MNIHYYIIMKRLIGPRCRWRSWIRWVGVATTLANWVTMTFVHASLEGKEDPGGVDGPRCTMGYELVTFKLKWMAQFINQAFQV